MSCIDRNFPQCIDYKPYETRQAKELKLDCRVILMGGTLSLDFCSVFETHFNVFLSKLRQCRYGTHGYLQTSDRGYSERDIWDVSKSVTVAF